LAQKSKNSTELRIDTMAIRILFHSHSRRYGVDCSLPYRTATRSKHWTGQRLISRALHVGTLARLARTTGRRFKEAIIYRVFEVYVIIHHSVTMVNAGVLSKSADHEATILISRLNLQTWIGQLEIVTFSQFFGAVIMNQDCGHFHLIRT
jgi:hypothetical protein